MFTAGNIAADIIATRPRYLIAGGLIAIALVTGLLLKHWLTQEKQSLSILDTCAPISATAKHALDTMLPEAEREFQRALSTLNSDTLEAVCAMLKRSD